MALDDHFEDNGSTSGGDNNNNDEMVVGDHSHINLEQSEIQFRTMAAALESESQMYRLDQKKEDLEGRAVDTEEDFKLRKYFEDSHRMSMENGVKPKKMGVSIHNLTVVGRGADVSVISNMLSPFKFIFNPRKWFNNNGTTFDILHNINTFCKDGELLLVLGRPGAGCSTLLRLISNQRNTYVSVKGDINYGGIKSEDWARYRGEAIYTPEEDVHHPTLTLRQTLDFALKCKTPGNRLPDETKRSFREKIFNLLVNMFGIAKQADTMVGNEFVRGLSGGERKRMTITEAMVSGAPIICWDCSTRGLDAASALDYAKSIRIMSDTMNKTTICSFYQASDSIYSLFDKVIVLEKGRCIYFGPGTEAKKYFLDLGFECEPRKSTPDFLTGVTNPQERMIRPGFEESAPQTSAEFEAAWLRSPLYHAMLDEQSAYDKQIEIEQPSIDFVAEVRAEKSRTTSKSRPYTTSFFTQVRALTIRHFQLIWGNKFSLFSRYTSVLIQAFVYGSVFFLQKDNLQGLFTRGGAIFGSLLFNAFLSQGELVMTYMGRRVLQKHKTYALYRPSAYHLAQIITDIPITFVQVTLFSIIAYFMFGFQYRADQFFIWLFTLLGSSLCITNLFRAFGNFTPSLYVGQNMMSVYLIFMLTYAGYTVPYPKMHPWFQWFFWINPFAYAFKALMSNEFKDMTFDCSEAAIPYGPAYQNMNDYRICPTSYSTQGDLKIYGTDYLYEELRFKISQRALNVIVIYLWWLVFIAMNMIALEVFDWTSGGYTQKVYKPGKAPKMNDAEDEKIQNKIVAEATGKMKETLKMRGGVFTWKHINYTVPVPGGTRLLLDDVEGWIKPGEMTALMGSSGAGKTTLLDVLAKRKTMGTIEGKQCLNGKPLDIDFERITGYVEQMDVHNPNLTVRESLRFSAKMRQDPSISIEEKYEYVEHVLEMMEMKHLGDALIGDLETGVGISVEERKRLTIGVELVAKPHILFLDEPTSGLDAQSSYNIVKFIRKLADAGMPLVCTIHQPSSVLFEYFDRLLLLAKGGKTVYFGDIGERSHTLTSYFQNHGVRPCTESENPAEYILEAIGAGVHGKSDVDWPAAWKSSPECAQIHAELDGLEKTDLSFSKDESHNGPAREFATNQWYQFWEVYKRMNIIWWRDPYYSFGRFAQAGIVGLIIGFTFYDLQDSSSDMTQRIFVIFQALILGIMMIFIALPQLFNQREYFRRDYASKFYSYLPFSISIVLVELPYLVITGTIFFVCTFWTSGLQYSAITGFYFWIYFVLYLFFCVSFGQAVGAICVNIIMAKFIIPLLIVFLFLFCGVMVPPDQLPKFWESWTYHLMPSRYFVEGIVTNVLQHVTVVCTEEDKIKFTPPPNQNCDQYTQVFQTYATGTVTGGNSSECSYCIYKDGRSYYHTLGWSEENDWRNFGILACYWVFNALLLTGFIYLSRKQRR
ncbi:ABC transporter G family protein [Heterostelium album PN500]|uniref:ABC transporter G family protein n=1 Tax=Heterostelium pallidum (strain ATCC 26659 / Pp 5 / PN500) TaxID=670386 RepID=D3BGA9_HETP5|nr:ABC transporter G family protein [Heterostelium album PN500]EFA79509.1 ABC transporter G family protein [Heterostelium album PN500]|eukprot:XP_020431630.1 ABC transporter G family protein [Heterostelium album PN500]